MSEPLDPAVFAHELPATDVPDFDTALRMITVLRRMLAEAHEALELYQEQTAGEHTIFLDAEHERMLNLLFEQGKLNSLPDDEEYGNPELEEAAYGKLHEALTTFVETFLDFQWDTVRLEEGDQNPPGPVLSA